VLLSEGWKPSDLPTIADSDIVPMNAMQGLKQVSPASQAISTMGYVQDLGWHQYIMRLDLLKPSLLLALIKPLTRSTCDSLVLGLIDWKLARLLLALRCSCVAYIMDATNQMQQSHVSIQEALLDGYADLAFTL